MTYRQITFAERYTLGLLRQGGLAPAAIASVLHFKVDIRRRDHSGPAEQRTMWNCATCGAVRPLLAVKGHPWLLRAAHREGGIQAKCPGGSIHAGQQHPRLQRSITGNHEAIAIWLKRNPMRNLIALECQSTDFARATRVRNVQTDY
ncbi:MAG: hypothetical protein Q8Q14_10070 [Gemmatimonadales bacterium]|nr:hypothetical protein [Gemmatimonadales bacterium]